MSAGTAGPASSELPTFSECVIGYRRWHMDEQGRLWPLWAARRPWVRGRNVARCSCGSWTSLRFAYKTFEGRRVLEPAPEHAAPAGECTCGLYSWRRPPEYWPEEAKWSTPPRVVGAVASWGRMQVHADGFRAEFACIVTLAWHPEISTAGLNVLGHIARQYRAELVELDELEQAAGRYGSPLPDTLRPPAPAPVEPPPRRRRPWAPPERRPEKSRPWRSAAFVAFGVVVCAVGVVLLDPRFVGWIYGVPRRSDLPVFLGVAVLCAGAALIGAGLWNLLWRDLLLDMKLAERWRRRATAAAGRSARSAAPRPRR